jgi:hypothetical protein
VIRVIRVFRVQSDSPSRVIGVIRVYCDPRQRMASGALSTPSRSIVSSRPDPVETIAAGTPVISSNLAT